MKFVKFQLYFQYFFGVALIALVFTSCARESKTVKKLTRPIDRTAEELVRVREVKSDSGKTRAVISPTDEKQLRIPF
jgi:hypothetical protein